ncbi:MAG: TadE/TadG family type IV pilus assembly protein [Terriglobales bacterium]
MRSVRQKNGEAGSALVEFALASVVILTVLFGIIDMGRALYAYDWVSDAARRGTRYAMVRGTSSCTGSPELTDCKAGPPQITTYVEGNAFGIDQSAGALTVTSSCWPASSAFTPPPCAPGKTVQVTVEYNFAFLSPFTPHSWTMTSSSIRTVSQ